ncbi:hypothetical protein ACFX13_034164 [Malus domestica]
MEGPRNSSSRKRKTREMSRGQVVLALPAPSVPLPSHLSTTATKMAGSREKPKEVVLAQSAPNAPPPPLHTTIKRAGTREKPIVVIDQCALNASPSLLHTTATKRAGTRKKAKEVALALSPPNAPPPPLKFMTARKVTALFDPDHHPQTPPVSARREQEEGAAAPAPQEPEKKKPRLKVVRFLDPDATESSSDDDYTPPVGRKRKEFEIVLEIKIPGENPISKKRRTPETTTKTRRKIIKDQKNEEELVGEKIVIKKETGSSSCAEKKVKESSSTSSTAGKKKTTTKGKKKKETKKKKKTTEVVDVLWEIPGEIPDLDLLEREKDWLLYRFFDGVPEYCEDIPPEVKVIR